MGLTASRWSVQRMPANIGFSSYLWGPYMPEDGCPTCCSAVCVNWWELLLSTVLSLVCKTINTTVHAMLWPTSQEAASSDGIFCTSEKHTAVGVRCVTHLPVLLTNIVIQLLFSSRIGLRVWNERQTDDSLTASVSCVVCICLQLEANINKLHYGRSIYRVFDRP